MRARLFSIVFTILVLSVSALGASSPPASLHQVGGHWTAWDPPASQDGQQIYVIVRGDTLWNLAKRFYGDPYLWPQLWEKNQYIRDAHWIYPGDPLVTGLQVTPVQNLASVPPATDGGANMTPAGGGEAPPAQVPEPTPSVAGVESAGDAAHAPIALGAETDIDCSGYIGEPDEKLPFKIVGSEYDVLQPQVASYGLVLKGSYGVTNSAKFDLYTGDIVYLNGGRHQGLSVGTQLTIVDPSRLIEHPITREAAGRLYRYLGRVRIVSVQDETSIAEISHSCDAVIVGSALRMYEPEPVPLARVTGMHPLNFPAPIAKLTSAPVILASKDDDISLGQDHVVYISRGNLPDVTPGDFFTIYRMNRDNLPPIVIGELAILSVHKRSAVAKIIQSRYPIYVGDRLDPK
jgi:hypothetical protein